MSLLKSLTLLALYLVAVLDAARFKCDYNYYKDAGGYLKFQEIPLKFDDAKQGCVLEGGILASPIKNGTKAAMLGIMKTNDVNRAVLTGFSSISHRKGIFSSVEGIRLSEIPHIWSSDEPDNRNNEENCIAMLPDGSIEDVICDEPLPHFCFLKEVRAKTLNACGPKNKDYKLDTTTGSCYKLHRHELVYDEAAKTCNEEGGHLLIINGDTEARAVKNLFFKNTSAVSDYVLIGFRYHKDSGEWMTLQGETIEEAGYAKWAPGELNNATNDKLCGCLDNVGNSHNIMLNNIRCDRKLMFICEKDPEILLCK